MRPTILEATKVQDPDGKDLQIQWEFCVVKGCKAWLGKGSSTHRADSVGFVESELSKCWEKAVSASSHLPN